MAKTKTTFFCQNCGAQSSKWIGKCPSCGEWNTYIEEVVQREEKGSKWQSMGASGRERKPQAVSEITFGTEQRIHTHNAELNRVLGGGLVPGSVVLIGGEPGIGKSTLMLQVALNCLNMKVLYISGEESSQQLRMRAERLGIRNTDCFILTETSSPLIFKHLESIHPDLV